MRCIYINLDQAEDRRGVLEASFAGAQRPGWELVRQPALGPADVTGLEGSLTPRQKACYASHCAAIESCLDDEEDVLIVEDDANFSPRAFEILDKVRSAPKAWDVLFLDLDLVEPNDMVHYARQWRRLQAADQVAVPDLASTRFASASAYVVRGPAKRRLAGLLRGPRYDNPYDLKLRDLCHEGGLQMRMCFPFLARLSPAAMSSQISQPRGLLEATLMTFRRLMFIDRDPAEAVAEAEALKARYADPGAYAIGLTLGALASDSIPDSW